MIDSDLATLLEWEAFGVQPMAGCTRLLADPRFPSAARMLARNMLDICADPGLRGLFKDAGRYLVAMCALYLHGEGGLTLAGLKRLSATSGFLSPGRARSLLLYLRHLGYIEPVASQGGHSVALYVPSDAFRKAWARHLQAAMVAAAVIEPGVRPLLDALDRPDVAELVNRIQTEGLLTPTTLSDKVEAPYVRVFMDRHAGTQIGWLLMIGDSDSEDFPSRQGICFSVAAIARRFDVSRAHVRRLLADARTEALIEDHGNGMVRFAAGSHGFIHFLYAAQLVQLLASAATALHPQAPKRRAGDQKCPVVNVQA